MCIGWFVLLAGTITGQSLVLTWPDPSTMPARAGERGLADAGVTFITQGQDSHTRVRQWNINGSWRIHHTAQDWLSVVMDLRQEQIGSLFQSQQLVIGSAYRRQLGQSHGLFRHSIGAGFQAGFFQMDLQEDQWLFSSQFDNAHYHFDPTIDSQEEFTGRWNTNLQPVVHAGLYYQSTMGSLTCSFVPSVSMLNAPVLEMDGWKYSVPSQLQLLTQLEYRINRQWVAGTAWWYTRLTTMSESQIQLFIRLGNQEPGETTVQLGGFLGVNRDPDQLQLMHGGIHAQVQWSRHQVGLRVEDSWARINRWGTRILLQYRYVIPQER